MGLLQYQSITAPVLVPTAAAEPVTVDRWQRPASTPVWAPQSYAYLRTDPSMFGVEIDVPLQNWQGSAPTQIAPKRSLSTATQTAFTTDPLTPSAAPPAPANSWQGSYPARVPAALRPLAPPQLFEPVRLPDALSNQPTGTSSVAEALPGFRLHQYQALSGPLRGEPIRSMGWRGSYPSEVHRARRLTEAPEPVQNVSPISFVAVPDHFGAIYPASIARAAWPSPRAPFHVEPPVVPDVTSPAPALSWRATFPDRIDPARRPTVLSQLVRNLDPIPDVAIFVDQVAPVRLRLTPIPAATVWPAVVPDVTTPAPLLAWSPAYPSQIHRLRFPPGAQRSIVTDTAPPAIALQAVAVYPDRIDRPRPHAAQSLVWTMDRFDPPTPSVVPLLVPVTPQGPPPRRPTWLYLAPSQPTFGIETEVPVMGWTGRYPEAPVRRRLVVPAPLSVAPLYLPDITVVAPPLSWQARYPDQIAPRISLRAHLAWVADRFDPPPPTTPIILAQAIYPDRILTARPSVASSPAYFARAFDDTLTATWFERSQLAPVQRRSMGPRLESVEPIVVPDVTDPAPLLSWLARFRDRIHVLRPITPSGTVSPLFLADITDPVPALAWQPRYPDRHVYRRVAEFLASSTTRYLADVTSPSPTLAWRPSYPDVVVRRRSSHATAPTGVWFPSTIAPPPASSLTVFPLAPDVIRLRARVRPGAPVFQWIYFLPPIPDVLAGLGFSPVLPAWLPGRQSPRRWTTERTSATIEGASSPTAWTPTYTVRQLARQPSVTWRPSVFQPPFGQALVVAASLGWRPFYPDRLARRLLRGTGTPWAGGEASTVEPGVVFDALGCLEIVGDAVTTTTLIAAALTETTLIAETVTTTTLVSEDLC